jgi:hypothetical protein
MELLSMGFFIFMCKEQWGIKPLLVIKISGLNPLNAKLNPICHLLALLGAHSILHVSRIRLNMG